MIVGLHDDAVEPHALSYSFTADPRVHDDGYARQVEREDRSWREVPEVNLLSADQRPLAP